MAVNIAVSIIGLDYGDKKIGVAIASLATKLPSPLTTIENTSDVYKVITEIIKEHLVNIVVVGLPRGLDGQETTQTQKTKDFVKELSNKIDIPIHTQDEALTSSLAKQELKNRGVKYNKTEVDALAATYILQDFLDNNREVGV